jgi:hypothetical protein
MSTKFDLSKEVLLKDGWTETGELGFFMEKAIPNRNPINNSEDSEIKLIIHGMYNQQTFAILLPDGGMLNFVANSLKELKAFEERIFFYDPPF